MSTALQTIDQGATSIASTWRTAAAIKAQREAVVQLMQQVMKSGIDYGVIPGTPKPTLYKPGSEKLLSMFRLAPKLTVEDLSTPDTIRYRVTLTLVTMDTENFVGQGIGEASSAESKYQWRKAICQEEWDDTPEDRRRRKWSKGERAPYIVTQVRAEMEDVANTVLKMAKKRAQIDATLTATAASDVFSQDAEELKTAGIDAGDSDDDAGTPGTPPAPDQPAELPRKQTASAQTTQQPPARSPQSSAHSSGPVITESQGRRFYAIWKGAGRTPEEVKQYLGETFAIDSDRDMPASGYDKACKWAGRQA